MKKPCLTIALYLFGFVGVAGAVTQEDFTLTVLKDNSPVREFNGEVALPFHTEYKLRLKNNHPRRASATVWIDGAKVSEMGDFILDPTGGLDLERFLDRSLTEGKRFKFVPLDHPDVDDPSRAENGIVKVEFRLERLAYIMPKKWHYDPNPFIETGNMLLYQIEVSDVILTVGTLDADVFTGTDLTNDYTLVSNSNTLCSATSAGATVPGSYSSQAFHEVDFDGEDEVIVVTLRMVGI